MTRALEAKRAFEARHANAIRYMNFIRRALYRVCLETQTGPTSCRLTVSTGVSKDLIRFLEPRVDQPGQWPICISRAKWDATLFGMEVYIDDTSPYVLEIEPIKDA